MEERLRFEGKDYELIEGKLYQVFSETDKKFVRDLYEPEYGDKSYKNKSGVIYRVVSATEDYLVSESHKESFEGKGDLVSLFDKRDFWTSMTLLSPAAPTVKDYVELRKKIMTRKSDFIDNTLSISTERAHEGRRSLRCFSVKPGGSGKTSWITKASLDAELLYFEKGDTLIFSGWFFLEEGVPTSIVDFEALYVSEGPGIRILFSKDIKPRIELKWADKPTWHLPESRDYRFPSKQWARVELKVFLSNDQEGAVELKIDGERLIEGKGQTLPFSSAIYDGMEVGITANGKGSKCILFVDDIKTKRIKKK